MIKGHMSPAGNELVLFSAAQVLPLYVVTFLPKITLPEKKQGPISRVRREGLENRTRQKNYSKKR